jgi:hypothetical protein
VSRQIDRFEDINTDCRAVRIKNQCRVSKAGAPAGIDERPVDVARQPVASEPIELMMVGATRCKSPVRRQAVEGRVHATSISARWSVPAARQERPAEHGAVVATGRFQEEDRSLALVIRWRVVNMSGQPQDVVLLVDIANVMGSRPDGWWRDRAAAATRLLNGLEPLNGAEVALPAGMGTVRITEIRAVLEGAGKRAEAPAAVSVLRADRDGDSEIVEEADRLTASGKIPLVVTADRGLRGRLGERTLIAGPGWLNSLLGR